MYASFLILSIQILLSIPTPIGFLSWFACSSCSRLISTPLAHTPPAQAPLRPLSPLLYRQVDVAIMIEDFLPCLDAAGLVPDNARLARPQNHAPAPLPGDVGVAIVIGEAPERVNGGDIGAAVAWVLAGGGSAAKFSVSCVEDPEVVAVKSGVDVNVHLLENVKRRLDVILEGEWKGPLGRRFVRDTAVDIVEVNAYEVSPD